MFNFIVWSVTALAAIPLAIYLYLTWNFNYWRKRGVTTAQPLGIFGSVPSIVTRKRNFILDIHDIYEKYKRDNRAVGIFMTRNPQMLLLHPKLIHDALVTNFTQFHDGTTTTFVDDRNEDTLVCRNPFWCAGEEWKQRRSEATPGLTQNRLKQSFPIWESSCKKLINYLERKLSANGDIIESKDLTYRFTADVMCDFIWGINAGTLIDEPEKSPIMKMARKWVDYSFEMFGRNLLLNIAPIWRKISPKRAFPKDTDEFFKRLQKDAIDMRKKLGNMERPDFLNHLLQTAEKKQFNLDDFAGHSLTVMLDGFETSAVVLLQLLHNLATYPATQEKLRLEIQTALKEENAESISYEKLLSLPYLDQSVSETLRLGTPIPILPRICTKPTQIEYVEGKFLEVPVGTVVVVPTYSLHLDEQYYPEPDVFKPERFDNAAHVELTKQGVFLPFGDGPRICMGMRIGLLSVKSAIVEILKTYQVSSSADTTSRDTKYVKSFVMTLDGDVMLRFTKLKSN